MKRNPVPKAQLPNMIPVALIEKVTEKANEEGLSRNEWLQKKLWEIVENK